MILAGRPFAVTAGFLEAVEASDLPESVAQFRRPLLIAHSPVDTVVGIENAARLFEAARHPKTFVSLDDADHLLSREADARYVGSIHRNMGKPLHRLPQSIWNHRGRD